MVSYIRVLYIIQTLIIQTTLHNLSCSGNFYYTDYCTLFLSIHFNYGFTEIVEG